MSFSIATAHSGISSVTAGDNGKVYFAAKCAESGQAFIECNLEGQKEWGHHNFVAWTGPGLLTFGEGTVFAGSRAHWNGTDHLWTVRAADKKETTLLAAKATNRRARGMSGLAYRDGKVYVGIDAKADWMANAADGPDVELDNCLPRYSRPKEKSGYDPIVRDDFLRLFRLFGTPPGQLTFGRS